MKPVRIAVIGAGSFGQNHLRVLSTLPGAQLTAVVDVDPSRAAEAGRRYSIAWFQDWRAVPPLADAAIVAVPTCAHAEVSCGLLEAGLDVLVEKPIAPDLVSAQRMVALARARGRLLNVGHVESFNPAVTRLREITRMPLFFEVHRLSPFTPRSLDVDVVLDLMIHDLEIVLSLVGEEPVEIQAAGIAILSERVDIANVRLTFATGCVANLTASRVSPQRVRKLRMFQPHEYLSVDYQRQDLIRMWVGPDRQLMTELIPVQPAEPLRKELEAFVEAVRTRQVTPVSGADGVRALRVALAVIDKIKEHSQIVAQALQRGASSLRQR